MNAWGLIIAAMGVGMLWWAKQQSGTLDGLIGDIAGGTVNAVTSIPKKAATQFGNDLKPAHRGNFDGIPGTAWINDL